MRILDAMLAQLGEHDTDSIARQVGMSEVRVEAAIAALSVAHVRPGDTITLAAASSALPADRLQDVMRLLGGEAGLARMADLMGYHKGKGSIWDSLEDLTGNLGCGGA